MLVSVKNNWKLNRSQCNNKCKRQTDVEEQSLVLLDGSLTFRSFVRLAKKMKEEIYIVTYLYILCWQPERFLHRGGDHGSIPL